MVAPLFRGAERFKRVNSAALLLLFEHGKTARIASRSRRGHEVDGLKTYRKPKDKDQFDVLSSIMPLVKGARHAARFGIQFNP